MGPNSLMVVYVDHLGIFLSRSIFCPVMESTALEFDHVPHIFHVRLRVRHLRIITLPQEVLEAQLPISWVPVLKTVYKYTICNPRTYYMGTWASREGSYRRFGWPILHESSRWISQREAKKVSGSMGVAVFWWLKPSKIIFLI